MSHPWRSKGEKRTIVWGQEQPEEVLQYLRDMQDAVRYALHVAYRMTLREEKHRLPPSFSYRSKTGGQGVVLLKV